MFKIEGEMSGRIQDEINDRINHIICEEVERRYSDILENNKKLKEERDFFKEQAILWRNDYKKEYEENKKTKKELEHRDSFFSIMRDILANNSISNEELAAILFCVVHEECWDFEMSKKELEIVKNFWRRKYC